MPRSFNQRPRQDATLAPHPSRMRHVLHIYRNRIPEPEEVADLSAEWLVEHQATKLPDAVTPQRTAVVAMKADHFRAGQWDTSLYLLDPGGVGSLRRLMRGKSSLTIRTAADRWKVWGWTVTRVHA